MITLKEGTELTTAVLTKLLAQRVTHVTNQKYYYGLQVILDRTMTDSTKPNNKLVNANAAYIVDVNVGYFMGQPISYTSKNEAYMKVLQDIFDNNDEQNENVQIEKDCSICGVGYELLYLDEDSQVRFHRIPPGNMILVYNTKITPEPWLAIRLYTSGDDKTYVELYEKTKVTLFISDKSLSKLVFVREDENKFGDIPAVEYLNNEELQGDFDKVKTLIDEYDKAESDTANDFEYFTDAYLHLHNLDLGTQEIKDLKIQRVLQTNGEAASTVEWVIKDIQDAATENYKKRLQKDIQLFSKTPNLTDEAFAGNLSGIALSYKLLGMEWTATTKERQFKLALQRRIMLINKILDIKGAKYDYRDIQMKFTRSIPQNVAETIDTLIKLYGKISEGTFLNQIPFIDNPADEIVRIETEREDITKRITPNGEVDLDVEVDTSITGEAGAVGEGTDIVQLNGAQVTAATGIVKDVIEGIYPKSTGISMLEVLFNMSTENAQKLFKAVSK